MEHEVDWQPGCRLVCHGPALCPGYRPSCRRGHSVLGCKVGGGPNGHALPQDVMTVSGERGPVVAVALGVGGTPFSFCPLYSHKGSHKQ